MLNARKAVPPHWWWLGLAGALLPLMTRATDGGPSDALRDELHRLTGATFRIHVAGETSIVSDAPEALAGPCAMHLNKVIPKIWKLVNLPKDAPVPEAFLVALFAQRADSERFVKSRKGNPRGTFTYLHDDRPERRVMVAFALDPRPLQARLRHAAFEMLLSAWAPGTPAWLREGLGECLEDAQLDSKGQLILGPPRGHLRDLRERVLAKDGTCLALKDLVRLDPDNWEKKGLVSYAQSWSLARFLLEDPLPREARMLFKLFSALAPGADAKENTKRVHSAFVEDEWEDLEKAWHAYVDRLVETPAEAPMHKALERITQRDYESAWPLMNQAVQLDPDYERLYYLRGLSGFYSRQLTSAVADLNKALELFPEYHAALFLRGRCHVALGDAAAASADFEACLKSPYREKAKQELEGLKK